MHHLRALRLLELQAAGDGGDAIHAHDTSAQYLTWYRDLVRQSLLRSFARTAAWVLPAIARLPIESVRRDAALLDPVRRFRHALAGYEDRHPAGVARLVAFHEELPPVQRHVRLPDDLAVRYESAVGAQLEMDSFLGVINAAREEIRRDLARGHRPERSRLLRLYRWPELIDDRPGMIKAATLLRRQGGVRVPWLALRDVQWTAFRKLAWLTRLLLACRR